MSTTRQRWQYFTLNGSYMRLNDVKKCHRREQGQSVNRLNNKNFRWWRKDFIATALMSWAINEKILPWRCISSYASGIYH